MKEEVSSRSINFVEGGDKLFVDGGDKLPANENKS